MLATLSGALVGLEEVSSALSLSGAGAIIGLPVAFFTGIGLWINKIIHFQNPSKIKAQAQLDAINKDVETLTIAIKNFNVPTFDKDKLELAKAIFPSETIPLIKILEHSKTIKEDYTNLINKLNKLSSNGDILKSIDIGAGFVKDFYVCGIKQKLIIVNRLVDTYPTDFTTPIIKILKNMGILKINNAIKQSYDSVGTENHTWTLPVDTPILSIKPIIDLIDELKKELPKVIDALGNLFGKSAATVDNIVNAPISNVATVNLGDLLNGGVSLSPTRTSGSGSASGSATVSGSLTGGGTAGRILPKGLVGAGAVIGAKLWYDTLRKILSQSKTTTKNADEEGGEEKGKWKKRKKKKKKKKITHKRKQPKKILEMTFKTHTSKWIEYITFKFPSRRDKKSNDRGTLIFHLKKGGTIKKVRVKRGTFSVIVAWTSSLDLGAGYRYWSQFNKHNIVNKNVLSYSINIITNKDRQKAIPIELKENSVKYK